jgi:hypothetical protein
MVEHEVGLAIEYASYQQIHDAMGENSSPVAQRGTAAASAAAFKVYISDIISAIVPIETSRVIVSNPGQPVIYSDTIFQHLNMKKFVNVFSALNSIGSKAWVAHCWSNHRTCGAVFQIGTDESGMKEVNRITPLGPFSGLHDRHRK